MAQKPEINRIAAINIASAVLLNAISFFTSPIFSRILGTQQFGMVSVYNTWLSFATLFVGLQVTGILGTAKAHFKNNEFNKFASSALFLSFLSFSSIWIISVIFSNQIGNLMELPSAFAVLLIPHAYGMFCVNFYNAKLTFEFKAGKNFVLALLISVCTISLSLLLIFFAMFENLSSARILGNGIIYIIAAIIIVFLVYKKGKVLYNKQYFSFALPLCLPLIIHSLSTIIQSQSDRLMLQKILNVEVVGVYGLAYAFANVLESLRYSFNNTWVPFYFEYAANNKTEEMLKRAKNYTFLFTGLVVGFILLTPEVFKLYASEEYHDGLTFIPIICLSSFFILLYTFAVNHEYYSKKTKFIAMGSFFAAASNIVLNLILIPKFGAFAAALTTLISYILLFVFHHLISKHIVKNNYPFNFIMFLPYLGLVVLALIMYYVFFDFWLIRWVLGSVMGIALIINIKRNKALF